MIQANMGKVGGMIYRIIYFVTLAFLLFLLLLALFFKTTRGVVGSEWGPDEVTLFAAQVITPFAAIFLVVNLLYLLFDGKRWIVYLLMSGAMVVYCYFGYCAWRPVPAAVCLCDPMRVITLQTGALRADFAITSLVVREVSNRPDTSTYVYGRLTVYNPSADSVGFDPGKYCLTLNRQKSSELYYVKAGATVSRVLLQSGESYAEEVYWLFNGVLTETELRQLTLATMR